MPINRNPGPRGDKVSFFSGLQALLRTPFFLPITIAVLFIGAGDAIGGSYLTLFAVDQGRMNPLELGIFLAALALSGIAVNTSLGRWFDTRPSVVPVFLALVMTTVGYVLLTATTRFYLQVLRAVGIGLIGYQGISYIQALMPNQVGIAAALFSNTTNAGFLLSGLTAGAWAQTFGYRSMFIACAVLSGLGLLLLHFQPTDRCT